MCLLIASYRFPDFGLLEEAESRNRDGIGIAWRQSDGKIRMYKGITMEQLKDFKNLKPGTPMLIHFRIKTVGEAVPELCHPFPITKDVELARKGTFNSVLAHNGHINNWQELLLASLSSENRLPDGDYWSDTRAMAYLTHVHGPNFLKLVSSSSRFAILDKEGFTLFGSWHEHDEDIYTSQHMSKNYSNKSHNTPTVHHTQTKTNDPAVGQLSSNFSQQSKQDRKPVTSLHSPSPGSLICGTGINLSKRSPITQEEIELARAEKKNLPVLVDSGETQTNHTATSGSNRTVVIQAEALAFLDEIDENADLMRHLNDIVRVIKTTTKTEQETKPAPKIESPTVLTPSDSKKKHLHH